jgi:hypothetical protein
VVKHADIGGSGAPGVWTELNRGATGDPRGSDTYGAGVWNDTRTAADCPAIDAWRAAAQIATANGTTVPTKPAPQQDCPATFGNSDIFGGSYADPTP